MSKNAKVGLIVSLIIVWILVMLVTAFGLKTDEPSISASELIELRPENCWKCTSLPYTGCEEHDPKDANEPNIVETNEPNDTAIIISPIATCYGISFGFADINMAKDWFDAYYENCKEHYLLRIGIGEDIVEVRWEEVFTMLGFDLEEEPND